MLICVCCFGLVVSTCQVIGWKDPSEDTLTWWGDYLRWKRVFVCIFLLFGLSMFLCVPPGPTQYIFHTSRTQYSLFVLKVSLNTNKPTNQTRSVIHCEYAVVDDISKEWFSVGWHRRLLPVMKIPILLMTARSVNYSTKTLYPVWQKNCTLFIFSITVKPRSVLIICGTQIREWIFHLLLISHYL